MTTPTTRYVLLGLLFSILAVLPNQARAQQHSRTFQLTAPVSRTVHNPCTNEDVRFEGTLNIDIRFERTGDREFTAMGHVDARSVTGVGLTSGKHYRGEGEIRFEDSATGFPAQFDADARVRMLGAGDGTDAYAKFTLRVVIERLPDQRSDIDLRAVDLVLLECRN